MNNEEQSALNAVRRYLDSYANKDIEGCMTAMSTSAPVLLYGTNDNEVFKTTGELRSAFTRDFEKIENVKWGEECSRYVIADTSLASVLIELPLSFQVNGEKAETLFRYSLTLTKENEEWKICSGIASVPFKAGTESFEQ